MFQSSGSYCLPNPALAVERWMYASRRPWVLVPVIDVLLAYGLPAGVNAERCVCRIQRQRAKSAEYPTQMEEVWTHVFIQRRRLVNATASKREDRHCRAKLVRLVESLGGCNAAIKTNETRPSEHVVKSSSRRSTQERACKQIHSHTSVLFHVLDQHGKSMTGGNCPSGPRGCVRRTRRIPVISCMVEEVPHTLSIFWMSG